MTTKTVRRYISVTETAKLIRQTLKKHFPDCKFSVRSQKYAGGASIDIEYTDYLPAEVIELVVKKYEGAKFDGMTDCKNYASSLEVSENGLEEVHYGSDYIFVERRYSEHYFWMLNRNHDLRTKPDLISQLRFFADLLQRQHTGILTSIIELEAKYYLIVTGGYDEYRINEAIKCFTKQGFPAKLIWGESTTFRIEVYKNEGI